MSVFGFVHPPPPPFSDGSFPYMISVQLLLSLLVFCAFTNRMTILGSDNTYTQFPKVGCPILEKQVGFHPKTALPTGGV